MKILIVSQYFWPENFRINDLTQELVQRGHSVTVLTGIPNYPAGRVFDAYRQNPKAFGHYGGAKVWRVPMLARGHGAARLFLNYLSFVIGACLCGPWRVRGQQADVIFVFEPSPVTVGLPAVLLGGIKHAPVVFWALDLWPETLAAIGVVRSPRVLGWVGQMVKFIYERCTLVLGQSRGFLGSIAKYCSDANKIRYFPSWAEEVFSEPNLAPAPEVPVQAGVFNVLFAGNIGEAQDLPAVLDAAEVLKHNAGIRWLIVGDGRMSNWLEDEVSRRGLQSSVMLLGRFPVERMPSFYAHADVLMVSLKKDPTFSMTIPGKVQSYLMAGIPLVGMLDGEGAKVITEANAGLVCAAGDSGGLAAAVLELAAMSVAQRHQLGVNGRVFAQKEFGRTLLMDRLETLMLEAVFLYRQEKVKS
ncbi:glycosyltransferase family 4 protein [Rhodoferax antarcticus]|uniref:Putative glycosyl transferase group 1 n=1 Tax=Rhodoferax antarcticus ANT.BR TaxID=1111071 RepID=A0A1Q8YJV1_9BURK|nr:glycosyltransferase family 4 protein [Rhodoferax antarcticus]APW47767.1 glycosyltransferase WbuB [Rhodoferax antarcticus]OLP08316.1 putative glycosyl transferase group 1 [Rhodoferax antarcticus ANT.BR]